MILVYCLKKASQPIIMQNYIILFFIIFVFYFHYRLNVGCGPAEERILLTGLHAVADIYCENCKTTLGWKYVRFLSFFVVVILLSF